MGRNRLVTGVVVALVLALALYAGERLFAHSSALLTPAIVTPAMDAHTAVSPNLDARIVRLIQERRGDDRSTRPKLVALTFDDGPYPVDTPLLLDRLHDLRVPATFFLIGRDALQFPALTRRIEAAGNEIANHTLTHPNLDQESPAAVRAELDGGRKALAQFSSDPAIDRYFRPPHGRYTEETLRVAQGAGYDTILWNDDPGDWRLVSAETLAAHIEAHATAPDIVLLHSGRIATVEMLDRIVPWFRAKGYEFVTVGELLRRASAEEINHPAREEAG